MTQINPFTGTIVNPTVQQQQGVEKKRQIRRMQNLGKNAALQGDRLEHQVESSDALHAINDQGTSYHPQQRRPGQHPPTAPPEEGEEGPHLDLKA